jgi:hypothetical protein
MRSQTNDFLLILESFVDVIIAMATKSRKMALVEALLLVMLSLSLSLSLSAKAKNAVKGTTGPLCFIRSKAKVAASSLTAALTILRKSEKNDLSDDVDIGLLLSHVEKELLEGGGASCRAISQRFVHLFMV